MSFQAQLPWTALILCLSWGEDVYAMSTIFECGNNGEILSSFNRAVKSKDKKI